jgi:hypothetical protein
VISVISGVLDRQAIVFSGTIAKQLAQRLIQDAEFYNQARRRQKRPTPRVVVSPINGNVTKIRATAMAFKSALFLSDCWRKNCAFQRLHPDSKCYGSRLNRTE